MRSIEVLELNLTVTAGYEEYRDGAGITEWIDGADQKLYEGKNNGKNQVVA